MIQERRPRATTMLTAALLALGGSHAAAQNLPAGHVPVPRSGAQEGIEVVVLETMNGGGYTYARVEMEGEETWLAGPQVMLGVGDTVLVTDPMPMEDFTSSSLDRTFDVLYFIGGYQQRASADAGAGATPSPGVTDPHAGGAASVDGPMGEAREVLHSAGYTYVHVEMDGESVWIAGPMTQVDEAAVVSWRGETQMGQFTSRTLNRTFEAILFVQEIIVVR